MLSHWEGEGYLARSMPTWWSAAERTAAAGPCAARVGRSVRAARRGNRVRLRSSVSPGDFGMRSRQASADDEPSDDSPTLNSAHVVFSLALAGRTDPWRRARRWLGGPLPMWVCLCRPPLRAAPQTCSRFADQPVAHDLGESRPNLAQFPWPDRHPSASTLTKKLVQCPDADCVVSTGVSRRRAGARRRSVALVQQ